MDVSLVRFITLLAMCTLVACSPAVRVPPQQSQLETRQIQTREFATKSPSVVMKAVLNTLQDEGFSINNAVSDLGLITATKEVDAENKTSSILSSIFEGPDARWKKAVVQEATVNVSPYGSQVRVRISLHEKVLDNRGGTLSIREIQDGYVYRELFSKVDKSIFIQHEQL